MLSLGDGIAIASVMLPLGILGIKSLPSKNGYVRKDYYEKAHKELENDIGEIKEKIDKIYDYILEKK